MRREGLLGENARMPERSRTVQAQSDEMELVGEGVTLADDLFHWILRSPWKQVLAGYAALYLATNLLFAAGYTLTGGVSNAREGSFADAFWFSVQTLGTIGYGGMAPTATGAHLLVTCESMLGLLITAVVAGLTFAKFSVPRARVRFTSEAVIFLLDGLPTLGLRIGNLRSDLVVGVELSLVLLRPTVSPEGHHFWRSEDVRLRRSRNPALTRGWTVLHAIDAQSPLAGVTPESFAASELELQVAITGTDSLSGQPVNATHTYEAQDLRWGYRHADAVTVLPDGRSRVDLSAFDRVVPCKATPAFPYPREE